MLRRLRDIALPLAAVVVCAAPSSAFAQDHPTGGAQATVDRPALELGPGALLDRTLRIRGRASQGDVGRSVLLQLRDLAGGWIDIASTVVDQDGTFAAAWRPDVAGRQTLRAMVGGDGDARAASDPLVAQVTVFRPAVASFYGPGLYGRRTACGVRLTRRTLGVAHRELPCGTQVDVFYGGRTLTVPVIDRGPFRRGRSWDLTKAAAVRLGMSATATIGVLAPAAATPPGEPRRSR